MSDDFTPELTAEDQRDLDLLNSEEPGEEQEAPAIERCLLDTWRHLLDSIEESADAGVNMESAQRIVATWPKISYAQTVGYHRRYHELMRLMRTELQLIIKDNPGALDHVGPADAQENHELYVRLLGRWNARLERIIEAWAPTDPSAAIEVAAVSGVQEAIFGQMGLANHLDVIGFQLTEQEMAEAFLTARDELAEEAGSTPKEAQ